MNVKFVIVLILILLGIAPLTLAEGTPGAGQRFAIKDLTVEDLKTGHVWTRDANQADSQMSWYDAAEYVSKLNRRKFAGYSDWRLPDIEELQKLAEVMKQMNGGKTFSGETTIASVLQKTGFRNVHAADYWTSTSSIFVETEAWYYSLAHGSRAMGSKWLYRYVWPVRWESRKSLPPYGGNGGNHDKRNGVAQTR